MTDPVKDRLTMDEQTKNNVCLPAIFCTKDDLDLQSRSMTRAVFEHASTEQTEICDRQTNRSRAKPISLPHYPVWGGGVDINICNFHCEVLLNYECCPFFCEMICASEVPHMCSPETNNTNLNQ